ncbi:MAG TPA: translation initiation factor IF-3 [Phycisphaerae bacterium]|nr:translation initiation factor IF-3 [Phycisphaerae bacterium]
MKETRQRINDQIKISPLRVIGVDGEQLGIIERDEALQRAADAALDLVEVAPNVRPPVCKIMDFGKFKYEQSKKSHKSRAKSHEVRLKEIRIRPKTEAHDRDFKIRRARDFLEDGDKVMVNMLFRGRELSHPDYAEQNMKAFVDQLADVATVERGPSREGRRMILILLPNKKPS